ncbi:MULTISPECIES: lipocalin-like domain-containing protein [Rhodomicrobium]|uniref:lipocalin-like domain-containing protein n=1 Tax=Rhodomicrobium TaxID=1068 RepID=UPI001AECCC15|nr:MULTISPECIES: lipocalin-like domain-containing protein [Rhodomicrobium]
MTFIGRSLRLASILAIAALTVTGPAMAAGENKVVGTWRIVKGVINPGTDNVLPYGPDPRGMLVFTPDMHFIEVLHDPRVPKFAVNARDKGTAEENAAAMAGAIAFYGTYTVDANGEFSGNTVLGSTFPNWIGEVRTTERLRLVVEGDKVMETFTRPEGLKVVIEWERVE